MSNLPGTTDAPAVSLDFLSLVGDEGISLLSAGAVSLIVVDILESPGKPPSNLEESIWKMIRYWSGWEMNVGESGK